MFMMFVRPVKGKSPKNPATDTKLPKEGILVSGMDAYWKAQAEAGEVEIEEAPNPIMSDPPAADQAEGSGGQ